MAGLSDDEELELEIESAKAKTRMQQSQNANLGAEIQANQPTPIAQEMQPEERQPVAPPEEGGLAGWAKSFGRSVEAGNHPVAGALASAGEAAGDLGMGVVKGVYNAPRNILSTALGANEMASKGIQDFKQNHPVLGSIAEAANKQLNPVGSAVPQGTEQAFDQAVPQAQYTSGEQALAGGATEFGVGMLGGGVVAGGKTAVAGLPKIIANLGKYFVSNASGVAAIDPETKTLITGDNAQFGKLVGGLSLDPSGNYSEDLMRKRLNLLGEALVVAKPTEFAVGSVAKLGKFVYDLTAGNLSRWASMGAKEREVAGSIVAELDNVTGQESAKELEAIHQRVADKIRAGAKVEQPSDLPGVDAVDYNRPTAEAYAKGAGTSPEGISPAELSRARGMQSSAAARGLPELDQAMAQPSLKLEKAANQTREVFGGQQSVENSRQGVVKAANDEMAGIDQQVAAKKQNVAQEEASIGDTVRKDPYLGPALKDEDISLGLRKPINQAADKIVEAHNVNKQSIIDEGNAKFKGIGGEDIEASASFNRVYEKNQDYIPQHIKDMIEEDPSYGGLKTKVVPELSREIDALYNSGTRADREAAMGLRQIKDNINQTQLNALKKSGNRDVAARATEADRHFIEEVAPNRQGLSQDLTDIKEKNRLAPEEQVVQSRKKLKATFDDPDQIEHTRRVLNLADSPQEATSYVLGNVAEDLHSTLTSRGAGAIDPEQIAKSLRPYADMLPAGESKRLTDFVNNLKAKKGDVAALQTELESFTKAAEASKKKIQDKELAKFFTDSGVPVKNPDDVFTDVMNGKHSLEELDQIKARLKSLNDPEIGDGLKSAYARFLKEKVFRGGETRAGSKNINEQTLSAVKSGKDKLLEIGDAIHGSNSTVMKIYRKLLDEAGTSENFRSAPKTLGEDISKYDKGARQGIDFMITQVFGQLNRWGSRLRSVTAKTIGGSSAKADYLKAMDAVMSDPQKAADLIEQLGKEAGSTLSKGQKKRILQWGINSGIYQPNDEKKLLDDTSDQTDKALSP